MIRVPSDRPMAATVLFALAIAAMCASAGDARPSWVQALEHVTIFVDDQDRALRWYVDQLGLVKTADQRYGEGERWLTVAPPGTKGTHIVLAIPREQMKSSIGQQHNWVFRTGDCRDTYQTLSARGVKYLQDPSALPWGCQAIVEDPFGNRIVLLSDVRKPQPSEVGPATGSKQETQAKDPS